MTLTEQITQLARQAKAASRELALLTTAEKNACLLAMAGALEKNADALKQANALDMEAGAKLGLSSAMLDRLKLDDKRVAGMAKGLREVAALADPVVGGEGTKWSMLTGTVTTVPGKTLADGVGTIKLAGGLLLTASTMPLVPGAMAMVLLVPTAAFQ